MSNFLQKLCSRKFLVAVGLLIMGGIFLFTNPEYCVATFSFLGAIFTAFTGGNVLQKINMNTPKK